MILWSSIRRLAHIIVVIARHALTYALSRLLAPWPKTARRLSLGLRPGPERFRSVVEDLGGTFIKFGQLLALQPDILPMEYCNALYDLLDRIAPFDFAEVEKTFQDELGRASSEIFDVIEHEPIATASIGQVHVAFLNGCKYAVKVQRPNAEREFAGDLLLMIVIRWLVKRLRIAKLYWMIEPIDEFVAWTYEELDYRCEARYMDQLRRNARDNPREFVPAVIWEYTTRRTLVAEFAEGVTILDYLRALEAGDDLLVRRLQATGFNSDELARHVVDNFVNDVYRHGMFHADLHPANLMILPDNVIGYIDFGITGVISAYYRQALIMLLLSYTRGDVDGMLEQFYKVSVTDKDSDREGFREGLNRMADEWYRVEGGERRYLKSITLVMLDMLRLSRQMRIWPDRDVIKYIRSTIAIDGLRARFAPSFNAGRYIEGVCVSHLKWHVRTSFFTYDTFISWVSANAQLLQDGAVRTYSFLHRTAQGELPARAQIRDETKEAAQARERRRALQLAITVFVISLIIIVRGAPAQLGINLFTAEVLLMIAAAMTLWRTLRRLA